MLRDPAGWLDIVSSVLSSPSVEMRVRPSAGTRPLRVLRLGFRLAAFFPLDLDFVDMMDSLKKGCSNVRGIFNARAIGLGCARPERQSALNIYVE